MIEKVVVKRNERFYNSDFRSFDFKPGLNIIVGPNTSGKSSLLELIERYNGYNNGFFGPEQNGFKCKQEYIQGKITGKVCKVIEYAPQKLHESQRIEQTGCDTYTTVASHFQSRGEGRYNYHTYFSSTLKDKIKFSEEQIAELKADNIEYSDKECIIIADEPENSMGLNMQLGLFEWFREFTKVNKNVQIIIATHSFAMFECIKHKDVNIIEMKKGWINLLKEQCKMALQDV